MTLCSTVTALNNQVLAQTSHCPYDYYELPVFISITNSYVFTFRISYQGKERLAYGQVADLERYFSTYEHQKRDLFMGLKIADLLAKNRILVSKVPLDSLKVFGYSPNPAEADAIAEKGEQYFLRYYFNEQGCLRQDRKVHPASVMKHLQNWCILASEDHETGCLVYHSKVQYPAK